MMDLDPNRRQELADAALIPILRLALFLNGGVLAAQDGEVLLTDDTVDELERLSEELTRTSDGYAHATVEESFALLVERSEPRGVLNDAWALVRDHGVPALQKEAAFRFVEWPFRENKDDEG